MRSLERAVWLETLCHTWRGTGYSRHEIIEEGTEDNVEGRSDLSEIEKLAPKETPEETPGASKPSKKRA